MTKELTNYLGKFTVISLFLIEAIIVYQLVTSNTETTLSGIAENWAFIAVGTSFVLLDLVVYISLIEFYKPVTSFLFERELLEYTYAKKSFQNGSYEVEGKPIKSYDKLPHTITDKIDKLDDLFYNNSMPHFFDLIVASMNSFICFFIGILKNSNLYLLAGGSMSIFFILLCYKAYIDIGTMITVDYKSIFEE